MLRRNAAALLLAAERSVVGFRGEFYQLLELPREFQCNSATRQVLVPKYM